MDNNKIKFKDLSFALKLAVNVAKKHHLTEDQFKEI